jgi:phosphodiesterase/alkaline phosphatase D-like protein
MKKDKDNLNTLWATTDNDPLGDPVETMARKAGAKTKAQKADFVGYPLSWLKQILPYVQGECQVIAAQLMYRQWVLQRRPKTFTFPSRDLKWLGIDRAVKTRMLTRLEEAGLISVKQQHGHAPQVTPHWK